MDAAYGLALDRLILISANPNQLHVYDPVAHSEQLNCFISSTSKHSLSPDGKHAAVAFANAVSYIDLQGLAVSNTFSSIAVGNGKEICGAGYVYVFPSYNGSIISINVGNGQTTTTTTIRMPLEELSIPQ